MVATRLLKASHSINFLKMILMFEIPGYQGWKEKIEGCVDEANSRLCSSLCSDHFTDSTLSQNDKTINHQEDRKILQTRRFDVSKGEFMRVRQHFFVLWLDSVQGPTTILLGFIPCLSRQPKFNTFAFKKFCIWFANPLLALLSCLLIMLQSIENFTRKCCVPNLWHFLFQTYSQRNHYFIIRSCP